MQIRSSLAFTSLLLILDFLGGFDCLQSAGFASSALAAESIPNQAELLIKEGIELRRLGQDFEALGRFEKAYSLESSPRAAAQLGLCLQALGRWSEAEPKLSQAIKSQSDRWVAKNKQTLRDTLEECKLHIARIEIHGSPDGAKVTVNGKEAGTLPLPEAVIVNAGNVDVELSKATYRTASRSLSIQGGHYERLVLRLEPVGEKVPIGDTGLNDNFVSAAAVRQSDTTTRAPRPFYRSAWFWVGAAAVAVAAGSVAILSAGNGPEGPRVDDKGNYP